MSAARPEESGFTPLRRSAEFRPRAPVRTAAGSPQPCRGHGGRRAEGNGFTLVEMLVALSIFSLAALALLRLGGATLSTSGALREQALAQIVARNIAVETLTDPQPPAFGQQGGQLVNGGRRWTWARRTARSPEPRIAQIEISVRGESGPGATLVVFRRAGA